VPGIWEVVFYAPFTNSENSLFDYEFTVSELNVFESVISNFSVENGKAPSASFTAVNNSDHAAKINMAGSVKGIQRTINVTKLKVEKIAKTGKIKGK